MPWPLAPKLSNLLTSVTNKSPASSSIRFAFKLFRELSLGGKPNLVFSPASVMSCLLMLHDAASGETRHQMARALEIAGLRPDDIESTILYLRTSCDGRREAVRVANSLWMSPQTQVLPEYSARVRDLYRAELSTLDLAAPQAVSRINAWVSEKTNGKIAGIVSTLPELAGLVALNAIYFKGQWGDPFDEKWTRDWLFQTASGPKKRVPMMSQSGNFSYYEDWKLQAVGLPYRGGLTMCIVLPRATTDAPQFQPSLTSDDWEWRLARFARMEGTVRMPRFQFDLDADLNSPLKALGIERAFDKSRGEFDGVRSEAPIWIDQVLHRAVVEVNEQGTEAAAVTSTIACWASPQNSRPPRPFEMTMDRPFFFAIRDQLSGTILFMGWVGDPA